MTSQEHPGTSFVQDRDNQEELARLRLQDQMMTRAMGGVLPEQPDPTRFSRVLDVGCGTGSWLIELARVVPTCSLLVGVDVSRPFVQDARAQAEATHVSDRVEFQVMDALRMLQLLAQGQYEGAKAQMDAPNWEREEEESRCIV